MNKKLIICLGATFGTGVISKFLMGNTAKEDWYLSLIHPSFSPPNWVFGLVWPLLYFTMAIGAYLIWQQLNTINQHKGLLLFFGHLPFTSLWIYLFFVNHNFFVSAILLIALALCAWIIAYSFFLTSKKAAYWFLPYALWISYAATLSFEYYRLNCNSL